jgi:hypothetical protein
MQRSSGTPLLVVVGVLVSATAVRAQHQGLDELPSAERYTVRAEYLWWKPPLEGEIQKGLGDVEGTLLDTQADLGIGEGTTNQIRAAFRLGRSWKLRGSWSPIDFRGDVSARQFFVFGTTAARAGDRVVTTLKGNYFTGDLEWDFLRRPGGFLGATFGAKYFDVDTLLLDVDTSSRVTETQRLPIPVVGLAGRAYLWRLSAETEFSGMAAGDRGHVWETLIALRFHVSDRLAATGGYRRLVLEGKTSRDYMHLDLGTWTYGVEISL